MIKKTVHRFRDFAVTFIQLRRSALIILIEKKKKKFYKLLRENKGEGGLGKYYKWSLRGVKSYKK